MKSTTQAIDEMVEAVVSGAQEMKEAFDQRKNVGLMTQRSNMSAMTEINEMINGFQKFSDFTFLFGDDKDFRGGIEERIGPASPP